MKKLIIGLLFLTISLLGYTENKVDNIITAVDNTTEAVNQSTKEVNATVVYFTEKLEELGKSLKVPAEHVYQVLVKQQTVRAYTSLFSFFALLAVYLITTYFFVKADGFDDDSFINVSRFILILISGILTLICGAIFIFDGFTGIINPEYGAIKEIMSLF